VVDPEQAELRRVAKTLAAIENRRRAQDNG
jgi:hypothetical protein